ncbi:hypothetical protein SAMD00023353_0102770 [Rosellinia necatrix]|uniref:2EXR domain-containing protein n=1 Tax=Rosellinia necatrix TaxID=77044 RepID=A0A1S8A4N6_ROSNE|nr:hypothetical protein SAMD00023353_0102770 [Rosellinia necatrix]
MQDTVTQRWPLFHYFPLLPAELRLKVWRYCLPFRVIEVYDAPQASLLCAVPGIVESLPSLSLEPPIISRVCREARNVVLSRGGIQPIGLKHMRAWFDTRTDIISIDPEHVLFFVLRGNGLMRRQDVSAILQGYISDPTIPLAISSQLIEGGWECLLQCKGTQRRRSVVRWAMECMSQRTECVVVLDHAAVHLDYDYACACGLWGLLAESSLAYVDAQDPAQIQKLRNVHRNERSTGGKYPERPGIKSLGEYFAPENTDQRIASFTYCVEALWLQYRTNPDMGDDAALDDYDKRFWVAVSSRQPPKFTYVVAVHLVLP